MDWTEVLVFVAGLLLGGIIGVAFDRIWTRIAGDHPKLAIDVESDGRESGDTQTLIYLTNAGDFFERDVRLNIETAVGKEDAVRFIHVQSETNDQIRFERSETWSETNYFNHHTMAVDIDGMEKGDVVLVVAASTHYIPTLKVDAISSKTSTRYNSIGQNLPLIK